MKAIANLEEALKECDRAVEAQDKQAIPSVQQNALTYVGQIEEAMMKGFPFTVPPQYDNLPQLKASCPALPYLRIVCRPSEMPWSSLAPQRVPNRSLDTHITVWDTNLHTWSLVIHALQCMGSQLGKESLRLCCLQRPTWW